MTGCSAVSPGCGNCWAQKLHEQRYHAIWINGKKPAQYEQPWNNVQCHPERLEEPLHWKTPQVVAVNLNGDLFHEDVPAGFIARVFDMFELCIAEQKHHRFLILTKRAQRMGEMLDRWGDRNLRLPNVTIGVSVEDQNRWDERIPHLAAVASYYRVFVSAEPLLGPIDTRTVEVRGCRPHSPFPDWMIVGGESGAKGKIRPMQLEHAQALRDACLAASPPFPFYFKQWGEYMPCRYSGFGRCRRCGTEHVQGEPRPMIWVGKRNAARKLDGREWNEHPLSFRRNSA